MASKPCSTGGTAHGKETPEAARWPPQPGEGDARPGRLASPHHVPGETHTRHM